MLTIRKAVSADLLPLLQFAELYHQESQAWDFYGELDGEWLMHCIGGAIHDTRSCILVAIKDGELVGVHWSNLITQMMAPVDLLSTQFFFVKPAHRSYLVASSLLAEAERWGVGKGAKGFVAGCNFSDDPKANRAAELLHGRKGFVSFGTTHFKYL